MRQVAEALQTWPNNLYHHVGDRDAVVRGVLERVVSQLPIPPAQLDWQDWFRLLLLDGRDVLGRYRGAAMRLCRDGPSIPSAVAIIDRGVGILVRAGFGDDAPRVYSALLNGALLLVSLEDERVKNGQAAHQAATRLRAMPPPADADPDGWDAMHRYLTQRIADPRSAQADTYRYTVEILIAGAASRGPSR